MIKNWKIAIPLIALFVLIVILALDTEKPKPDSLTIGGITDEFNASKVKDEYTMEKAAFIKEEGDAKIIVGDETLDEFKPEVTLEKWDEVSMTIKYVPESEKTAQDLSFENEKIVFNDDKKEVHFYEHAASEDYPEGAYEIEFTLPEKPATNVFEFDIETQNLDFFYQPELTQEEIDEGAVRPDNVIGSYADRKSVV